MSYQFKYMDVPAPKAERKGGGIFKGVKFFAELCLTIFALTALFHYYTIKTGPQMPDAQTMAAAQHDISKMRTLLDQDGSSEDMAAASVSNAQAIMSQSGIAPSADVLKQAQSMAENFIATGDLSEFEEHAMSGDLGF